MSDSDDELIWPGDAAIMAATQTLGLGGAADALGQRYLAEVPDRKHHLGKAFVPRLHLYVVKSPKVLTTLRRNLSILP